MDLFIFIIILIAPLITFYIAVVKVQSLEKTVFLGLTVILFAMALFFFLSAGQEGVEFVVKESIPTTTSFTTPCNQFILEKKMQGDKFEFYCDMERETLTNQNKIFRGYATNGTMTITTADNTLSSVGAIGRGSVNVAANFNSDYIKTSYMIIQPQNANEFITPIFYIYLALFFISLLFVIQHSFTLYETPKKRF